MFVSYPSPSLASADFTVVNSVFFGHLTPAVDDLRYQHVYHPVPIEEKSPRLARVLNEVSAGRFGDGNVYEPYVLYSIFLL